MLFAVVKYYVVSYQSLPRWVAVGSLCELIRPLTGLVSILRGAHTPFSPDESSGVAGLAADGPTMGQVVLVYMIPVAGPKPDLTYHQVLNAIKIVHRII